MAHPEQENQPKPTIKQEPADERIELGTNPKELSILFDKDSKPASLTLTGKSNNLRKISNALTKNVPHSKRKKPDDPFAPQAYDDIRALQHSFKKSSDVDMHQMHAILFKADYRPNEGRPADGGYFGMQLVSYPDDNFSYKPSIIMLRQNLSEALSIIGQQLPELVNQEKITSVMSEPNPISSPPKKNKFG